MWEIYKNTKWKRGYNKYHRSLSWREYLFKLYYKNFIFVKVDKLMMQNTFM
mgnify:CR=1 FL=1